MPYAFGVDGGASKSRAVLATLDGEVLHIAQGPGVNYHECGAQSVSTTLHRLFQDCLEGSRARAEECQGLCFGLSGIGREHDQAVMTPVLNQHFSPGSYLLTSDADIALTSGSLSDQGILVIAGTGSMVYGKSEDGTTARAGGYGTLLSDEGSGYRIGLEALRTVVKHEEGLCQAESVVKSVYEALHLTGLEALVQWANSTHAVKDKIAALAPLMVRAAEEGDPVAEEILYHQADQLALCIESVYKKLHAPERMDVILTGGVLNHASHYWQILRRKIIYLIPGAHVTAPKLEAVLGAVLYALAHARIEINNDLISTLRRTYTEYKHSSTALPASNLETPEQKLTAQTASGNESEF